MIVENMENFQQLLRLINKAFFFFFFFHNNNVSTDEFKVGVSSFDGYGQILRKFVYWYIIDGNDTADRILEL